MARHGTGATRASICVLDGVANCKCKCEMTGQSPVRDHEGMAEIVPSVPGSSRHQSSLSGSRQDGLLGTDAEPVTRQKSDRARKQTRRANGRG